MLVFNATFNNISVISYNIYRQEGKWVKEQQRVSQE